MGIMLSETAQERLDGLFEDRAVLNNPRLRLRGERAAGDLAGVDGEPAVTLVRDDDVGAADELPPDFAVVYVRV